LASQEIWRRRKIEPQRRKGAKFHGLVYPQYEFQWFCFASLRLRGSKNLFAECCDAASIALMNERRGSCGLTPRRMGASLLESCRNPLHEPDPQKITQTHRCRRQFAGHLHRHRLKSRRTPLPEWAAEIDCKTWADFLLKFIVSHPAVTCAIPATSKVGHMHENMAARLGRMPDEATRKRMIAFVENP